MKNKERKPGFGWVVVAGMAYAIIMAVFIARSQVL